MILTQEEQNRQGPDTMMYPGFMTKKCRRQVWRDRSIKCDWGVK